MKINIFFSIALFAIFSLFSVSFPTVTFASSVDDQVVTLINQERTNFGLQPLAANATLHQAAYNHNQTMYNCSKTYGTSPCFEHQVTQSNEQSLMDRINALGYNAQYVAENIAWGQTSANQAVTDWMNSAGHKANILSIYSTEIGCSNLDAQNGNYQGEYWTCDFGHSFNKSTAQTPAPTSTATPIPTKKPVQAASVFPVTTNTGNPWFCSLVWISAFCK